MPVNLSRLRIAGFKSFADPVTVEILPGLTGVIGPNGCGKSNVVEALRWAMGESNARSLRGGEMEDVIFAGTTHRASRNVAEVVISLDAPVLPSAAEKAANDGGAFPSPWHEQSELQVVRRIERGAGSNYRVNGREVRARDVQTLFADMASGARASAMVSQGRVGALVSAKPEDRRAILEEAAGITGLHARRHEAELKLRAAEANLGRSEDLRTQLETQLAGLKKQARQASRYRNLSGAIREAEADLLAVLLGRAEAARTASRAALDLARTAVTEANQAARKAELEAADATASLPALREAEANARTALEREKLAQEQIAAEAERATAALEAAGARSTQIGRDLSHAEQAQRDADAADQRLVDEAAYLETKRADHPERLAQAAQRATEAGDAVRAAEASANRATEEAAALNAQSQALSQALAAAVQRARRLAEQLSRLANDRTAALARIIEPARLEAAQTARAAAEQIHLDAVRRLEQAEQGRLAAQAGSAAARDALSRGDAERARLAAECRALSEVLAVKDGERWPPMVDALLVPAGLEAALGAALGEELNAATNPEAARHWRELDAQATLVDATLPEGAQPLDGLVQAPKVLRRALSRIGLIDAATAAAAQAYLTPGQTLVSREGGVWRWDGYTIRSGAPTEAAVRLQQRNRLNGLKHKLAEAEAATSAARAAHEAAMATARAAEQAEAEGRSARRSAEQAAERARAEAAQLAAQAATSAARLSALDEQIAAIAPDDQAARDELDAARAALAALPDLTLLRARVEQARAALNRARSDETAARNEADRLGREGAAQDHRISVIAREREDWVMRAKDAAGRLADLRARAGHAQAELAALEAAPAEIADKRRQAAAFLARAETGWRATADALRSAESADTAAARAARAAADALSTARENAVRAEAAGEQSQIAWVLVTERITERLGDTPELPAPAGLDAETEERARRKFDRLTREREEMGPVNLLAETEAAEIETAITTLETERAELATAIAKLRGSIGHLNREGRERLAEVFTRIDGHFQALFTRMFGGGRAHLALVGSDDPLEAGLEIYAQPPGKKLTSLSLLSGGEQALTALSLIFAVFRCNPAPVCVLDEVDAPLDDANVERFCLLLDDMVRETGTRFLVVTHHHLTMARMDRLYGVTMQERGVSRLLSVDLQQAAALVDPPAMAAE